LPAHWRVGAKAKKIKIPAKKFASPSEGGAEGGGEGEEFRPARAESPVACSVKSRAKQKNFFSLIEKNFGGAQIRNV